MGWEFTGWGRVGVVEEEEDAQAVVLLRLGLLLGLLGGCLLLGAEQTGWGQNGERQVQSIRLLLHLLLHLPRWSWRLRSQSGFPRLPLPPRSPSPSWSSCPPSYHSQPFLSAGGRINDNKWAGRPLPCDAFGGRSPSLTFAAFLALGSALAGAGFCEDTEILEALRLNEVLLRYANMQLLRPAFQILQPFGHFKYKKSQQ